MAVRLRLKRLGRRHRSFFRITAVDSRKPRDGRVIEELGWYDPLAKDPTKQASIKHDRVEYWLSVGAQPSDTVRQLLKRFRADGTVVIKPKKVKANTKKVAEAEAPAEEKPAEAEVPAEEKPAEAEAPTEEKPAEAEAAAEEKPAEAEAPDKKPAAEEAPAKQPEVPDAPAEEPASDQ